MLFRSAGPMLGTDTETVLAEFGFDPAAVAELIGAGVVAVSHGGCPDAAALPVDPDPADGGDVTHVR